LIAETPAQRLGSDYGFNAGWRNYLTSKNMAATGALPAISHRRGGPGRTGTRKAIIKAKATPANAGAA